MNKPMPLLRKDPNVIVYVATFTCMDFKNVHQLFTTQDVVVWVVLRPANPHRSCNTYVLDLGVIAVTGIISLLSSGGSATTAAENQVNPFTPPPQRGNTRNKRTRDIWHDTVY